VQDYAQPERILHRLVELLVHDDQRRRRWRVSDDRSLQQLEPTAANQLHKWQLFFRGVIPLLQLSNLRNSDTVADPEPDAHCKRDTYHDSFSNNHADRYDRLDAYRDAFSDGFPDAVGDCNG
jgi:hypothetical protein